MSKDKAKADRGVDSVTDYVEEREVGDENAVKAQASLRGLSSEESQHVSANNITIKKEDIDFIAEECELPKDRAENLLRKSNGVLQDALSAFINGA